MKDAQGLNEKAHLICREDRVPRTFHHRMWRTKLWEDSQFSGLGGDAAKPDAGRRAGLGRAGSELTLDILQIQLGRGKDGAQDAFQGTPSHKGGGSMGEGRESIR